MSANETALASAQAWLAGSYDDDTKRRVQELMDSNPRELTESFYQALEFGTGGLRGIMGVGTNRMNKYTVGMATQGLANYLAKNFAALPQIKVAITHDCRNNSPEFARTVAEIFAANGFHVYFFDALRPTPELSFAVRHFGCQGGVMLTASHNPKEYNGYKAYWDDGAQVTAPHDTNIIAEVGLITDPSQVKWSGGCGAIETIGEEVDNIYLNAIKGLLCLSPEAIQKHNDIKIVYTPLHGCGVRLVPEMLSRMGFSNLVHVPEQDVNDGNFPTVHSPNPEEPTALELAVKKAKAVGAEMVMATDPDADRIALAVRNPNGEFVLLNGNQTNAIFTHYLLTRWKELGKLTGNEFTVRTIVSSTIISKIASSFGVACYDCYTGFKNIAEVVRELEGKKTYIGGGEESFGFNVGSLVRDKDAVVSSGLAAEVAAWAKEQGMTMLELLHDVYLRYGLYHERLISLVRKGQEGLAEIQQMMKDFRSNPPQKLAGSTVTQVLDYQLLTALDTASGKSEPLAFKARSNVLQWLTEDGYIVSVRPSGTEPKIKLYFGVREDIKTVADIGAATARLDAKIDAIISDLKI
ncbi:MAG: phospho-sugar mutase [Prevotellaceae bacterium]|jgi:phosphoglucomutase|nr:phospho-sugar mutase [Prevotellaceae bacterium]